MFCPNCGKNLPDNAKFCDDCGTSMSENINMDSSASNNAASQTAYVQPEQMPRQESYQQNNYAPQYTVAPEHKPLSIGDYIIMMILVAIPIVGFIMLLVWAISSNTNKNKKNYAIATLIMMAIGVVVVILFGTVIAGLFSSMAYNMW